MEEPNPILHWLHTLIQHQNLLKLGYLQPGTNACRGRAMPESPTSGSRHNLHVLFYIYVKNLDKCGCMECVGHKSTKQSLFGLLTINNHH